MLFDRLGQAHIWANMNANENIKTDLNEQTTFVLVPNQPQTEEEDFYAQERKSDAFLSQALRERTNRRPVASSI